MTYGKGSIKAFSEVLVRWGLVATSRVRKAAVGKSVNLGSTWNN